MSRPAARGGVPSCNDDAGMTAVSVATVATAGSNQMTASIQADRLTPVSKPWNLRSEIECPHCLPLIERQTNGYRRKPMSIRDLQLFEGPRSIWVDY